MKISGFPKCALVKKIISFSFYFSSVHGGELQTLLDIEGCLTEEQTIICLREILKALQYMHKLNIAHLDVKPQNILLNGEKVEGKSCKSFKWKESYLQLFTYYCVNGRRQ